jgi:hypothetical protein
MRFVPDVQSQFLALTKRADAMGLHIDSSPNPSACKHYQSITRVDGESGVPYFIITRSGILPDTFPFADVFCDDSPGETGNGHLIVFKLGSRDRNGERLRSNRLSKGVHVDDTAPPDEDVATSFFTVVEDDLVFHNNGGVVPQKAYQHPGGMQLIGHTLAVAVEGRRDPLVNCVNICSSVPGCVVEQVCRENDFLENYEVASRPTIIMFFDVHDPENPVFISQFAPLRADGTPQTKTGFVGVTPLPQVPGEESGRYLAVTTGGEHPDFLFFYRSSPGDISTPLSWDFLGTAAYPDVADAHQTMQFLREGDIHGDLYLAGVRGNANTVLHDDRDKIDLRRVRCTHPGTGQDDPLCLPGDAITVPLVFDSRVLAPRPSLGGTRLANFAAGSGFYISPTGELILYATEHDNDGPADTVKVGEWRHIDVVREGSPTLLPQALLNVPFEVDEGGSSDLRGRGEHPITKPWIELFEDVDFGGPDFNTLYAVVDYDDYPLDDFDNFSALELQFIPNSFPPRFVHHANKARSLKWFAPVGCSIAAFDLETANPHGRILVGTGATDEIADLGQTLPDLDQAIDAVQFLGECADYYATDVEIQWDLDGNGSYETTGNVVTFDASGLDGPSVINVPVRARHPFGGPSGDRTVPVTVRNVPPTVGPLRVTDSAGHELNVDVPFVLTGLPVTASATFTDPGLLDHQTATLAWGDGSTDADAAFTNFDQAFGDGAGSAAHAHRYAQHGGFTLELTVSDDDGGIGKASAIIDARTPAEATQAVIDLLNELIANTTDKKLLDQLQMARAALAGRPPGASGALNRIGSGQDAAAIAFLQQAITRLQLSGTLGADVATLIALLEQVVAAVRGV